MFPADQIALGPKVTFFAPTDQELGRRDGNFLPHLLAVGNNQIYFHGSISTVTNEIGRRSSDHSIAPLGSMYGYRKRVAARLPGY